MTKGEEALVLLAWISGCSIDTIASKSGINKLVVEQHIRHVKREKTKR